MKTQKLKHLLLVCLLSCWSSPNVVADEIVYENGVGGASQVSRLVESDYAPSTGFPMGIIQADEARLNSTTTITGIEWTGAYVFDNIPQLDFFLITIYEDNAGSPVGAPVASFEFGDSGTFNTDNGFNRVDSGFDVIGLDIYEYSADLNFTMLGGTDYWFSIANSTKNNGGNQWFWGATVLPGIDSAAHDSFDAGETWVLRNERFDFQLAGTVVPEPSSVGVLLVGLSVTTARRKRKP